MFSEFIKDTLNSAAKITKEKFGKVSGTTKTGDYNQVLTETDLAVGQFIIKQIESAYPDHNIIDEEAGTIDNNSDYTWVVDPIDGTSNFAVGSPLYGIMLGLLKGPTPIAGGIILPEFSQLYTAEKEHGSFCNGKRIYVSKETSLLSCLVAYQIDAHQESPEKTEREAKLFSNIILGVRNTRNSGGPFDAMMVAQGKYGACLNQTSKIWDNVAPHIIIEEAGGLFTDFFGKPMDYSDPIKKAANNFTQCTASPSLHKQVQAIIHATLN